MWMPPLTLFVYLGMIWWASWYPGAEPGGGGYVAQRIFSAKDERQGLLATLWFNVAHYGLRPWPWILTALASLILYPNLVDKEKGYIVTLMDPSVFPPALRGLMLAAFAAAYMSTIGTQLNWGASYVVNDFYRRFIHKNGSERGYVIASQIATVGLMIGSMLVMVKLDSIGHAWKILLATGAGTGGVLLLRWFWWRINAWSEVSAMISAAVCSIALQVYWQFDTENPAEFGQLMVITVSFTTLCWFAVTMLTKPEPRECLVAFYRKVHPEGPGWKAVAAEAGMPEGSGLATQFANWGLGVVMIYAALFGLGKIIFGSPALGTGLLVLSVVCGYLISRNLTTEAAPP
jgi:SSS family solute:Na+ symporter